MLIVAGCGASDPRRGVSGSVTLDGKALPGGVISFQPVAGNHANSAGSGIENGRYRIPADKGLVPGDYEVTVRAFEQTGRMVQDPQFGTVPETVAIPFKETGTLLATVADDGPNRLDFQLTRATNGVKRQ